MPKPTRRKTLSHHEIENVLNEISTTSNELNKLVELEDIDHPIVSGLATPSTTPTTPSTPSTATTPTAAAAAAAAATAAGSSSSSSLLVEGQSTTAIIEKKTDADLVREYCKLYFQNKKHNNLTDANVCTSHNLPTESKELAKQLYQMTQYKLITARLLHPEEFLHPMESNESKKSLIIGLTAMLTDVEEQRKKDTKQCEHSTRCRSNRIRGRSSYEYIDVDTGQIVEYEEFERRYNLFINHHKPKHICIPPSLPLVVEETLPTPCLQSVLNIKSPNESTKEIVLEAVEGTALSPFSKDAMEENNENNGIRANLPTTTTTTSTDIVEEVDKKLKNQTRDRKRKLLNQSNKGNNAHNIDRRGTLSSESAHAMALQAIEEGKVASISSAQGISTPMKAPEGSSSQSLHDLEDTDLVNFGETSELMYEEELISTDFLIESNIIDDVGIISAKVRNHYQSLDKSDDDSLFISANCSINTFMQTSTRSLKEETETKERKALTQADLYLQDLPMIVDEQGWERQAKKRLHERFTIAKNQFQWELVSVQAANSAIIRTKMKKLSSSSSSSSCISLSVPPFSFLGE